jgi:hypothetical protein
MNQGPRLAQQSAPLASSEASTLHAAPHAVGSEPEVLNQILDGGVNLSLWQRPVQQAIVRELSSLGGSSMPDLRCRTTPDSFDEDFCGLLRKHDLDPKAFREWRTDLGRIAAIFFAISDRGAATLRLETTDGDGCRRFHVDHTHLRLLCTYRGPGTEWLSDEQVDRSALANFEPNDCILRSGTPSAFETFWVGILKGEAYPGNLGHGLVHRSPRMAGSGLIRVVFCLDCAGGV